ncbi:MAG: pyruvate kinase [Bacteroidia bacterium]
MFVDNFNKTKIVATIGPASSSEENLEKLILAGVDVCRLNFSHGAHEIHKEVADRIRKINKKLGTHVAILQDLQGPKLRIGKVDGVINLEAGKTILVTTEKSLSTAEKLSVSYEKLAIEARVGDRILLNDGKLELKVTEIISNTLLNTEIINGGDLTSNKGFNLPNTPISAPCLTEKDIADLEFGLELDVDWIALSFVRTAEDVIFLKNLISQKGGRAKVIAKIEKPEAIENFDSIVKITDAVMVARGDLGVEIPLQKVPMVQKQVVQKCLENAKPVIIATQMMESMIEDSMPTRAEITDVANAVIDGADAVMLSAETSVGKYPVRVVEIMNSIIADIEKEDDAYYKGVKPNSSSPTFPSDEICFTAVRMSDHLSASAIVGMTKSGYTAFKIASYRPEANVFIFTDNEPLLNTLNLVWGVRGFHYDRYVSTDETFEDVIRTLKDNKVAQIGDFVINCASMPLKKKQRTNTIKISLVE